MTHTEFLIFTIKIFGSILYEGKFIKTFCHLLTNMKKIPNLFRTATSDNFLCDTIKKAVQKTAFL